jgi:hypothetical protein
MNCFSIKPVVLSSVTAIIDVFGRDEALGRPLHGVLSDRVEQLGKGRACG